MKHYVLVYLMSGDRNVVDGFTSAAPNDRRLCFERRLWGNHPFLTFQWRIIAVVTSRSNWYLVFSCERVQGPAILAVRA